MLPIFFLNFSMQILKFWRTHSFFVLRCRGECCPLFLKLFDANIAYFKCMESLLRSLGGLLEPFGGLLEASWRLFEAFWRPLGASWRPLEGSCVVLEGSCVVLEGSWRLLEASWKSWRRFACVLDAFWMRFGGLLEALGGLLKASWSLWRGPGTTFEAT